MEAKQSNTMFLQVCLLLLMGVGIISAHGQETAFQEVLSSMECQQLNETDVIHLTTHLLEAFSCEKPSCQCSDLFNSSSLLDKINASQVTDHVTFDKLSAVLLYYLSDTSRCHQVAAAELTYHNITYWLTDRQNEGGIQGKVKDVLQGLAKTYNNVKQEVDDSHDDSHDDHDHDSDDDHDDHDNDDHDDHDDHDSEDHDSEDHDDHDSDDDDHDHADPEAEAETTDDDHDEDHDDDHDDDHDIEEKCLDLKLMIKTMDLTGTGTLKSLEEASGWIFFFLLQDYQLAYSCDGLAYPEDLLKDLLKLIGADDGQAISMTDFQEVLMKLKIGSKAESEDHADEEEEDAYAGHDHRRKRSVYKQDVHTVMKRQAEEPVQAAQCYSAEELLTIYNINQSSISTSDFIQICPTLLQQQLSGACVPDDDDDEDDDHDDYSLTVAEKYGYSTLAVTIISLFALVGVILAPCSKSNAFTYILGFMVALAVGTLATDAMLHLIPMGFGLHAEHVGDHDLHEGEEGEIYHLEPYMLKSLVVLAAMYAFFILESILHGGSCGAEQEHHGHSHGELPEVTIVRNGHGGKPVENGNAHGNADRDTDADSVISEKRSQNCCGAIKSMAWMIIIGDAVHNFADGLAIGAAFSVDLWSGISTSLAVLCHEVPHEFGDFAVLISAGMSMKKALLMNLLSAVVAFAGLYIGLTISVEAENRSWIFTIAGGMFLYIALTNMVPELMSLQAKAKSRIGMFFVQNIGFLVGVALLTILSLFEEQIHIDDD